MYYVLQVFRTVSSILHAFVGMLFILTNVTDVHLLSNVCQRGPSDKPGSVSAYCQAWKTHWIWAQKTPHMGRQYVRFSLWSAFSFDLAFSFGSFCLFKESSVRVTASFQSLSMSDVSVVVFGLCICWYGLSPVVRGPDYFQFALHWMVWMVWIRKQVVICVMAFL